MTRRSRGVRLPRPLELESDTESVAGERTQLGAAKLERNRGRIAFRRADPSVNLARGRLVDGIAFGTDPPGWHSRAASSRAGLPFWGPHLGESDSTEERNTDLRSP